MNADGATTPCFFGWAPTAAKSSCSVESSVAVPFAVSADIAPASSSVGGAVAGGTVDGPATGAGGDALSELDGVRRWNALASVARPADVPDRENDGLEPSLVGEPLGEGALDELDGRTGGNAGSGSSSVERIASRNGL